MMQSARGRCLLLHSVLVCGEEERGQEEEEEKKVKNYMTRATCHVREHCTVLQICQTLPASQSKSTSNPSSAPSQAPLAFISIPN
jgi:hypothetical protein